MGQTGRVRAQGDERPMGTTASGGRWFKEGTRVSGGRPVDAPCFRQQSTAGVMPPKMEPPCRPPGHLGPR